MFAPDLFLAVILLFCIYAVWTDFKTREMHTAIGIAVLLFISAMSTISVMTSNLPLARIGIQSLVIASLIAMMTMKISKSSLNITNFVFTIGVFAPILYSYTILLKVSSPILPLALFIPGLLLWSVPQKIKEQLQMFGPAGKLAWTATYLSFIIIIGGLLASYMGASHLARNVIALNFFVPMSIQINSQGYGNGDILLLWTLIGSLIYLENDITAGYGILFYATLLVFVLYPARAFFICYRNDKRSLGKRFAKEMLFLYVVLIILAGVAFSVFRNHIAVVFTDQNSALGNIGVSLIITALIYIGLKLLSLQAKPIKNILSQNKNNIMTAIMGFVAYNLFAFHWFAAYMLLVMITSYYTSTVSEERPKNSLQHQIIHSMIIFGIIMVINNLLVASSPQAIGDKFNVIIYYIAIMASFISIAAPLNHILKYILIKRYELWQSIQAQLFEMKDTRTEPFSLELMIGLLMVIFIGTPAEVILKLVM